jgi:hypothetical protein
MKMKITETARKIYIKEAIEDIKFSLNILSIIYTPRTIHIKYMKRRY